MQILLDNGAYEFGNLGDVTMLMVAVRRLRELWPTAEVDVLIDRPDELRRVCPEATPLRVDGRNLWFQERNLLGAAYRLVPPTAAPALDAVERSVRLHMHGLVEPWIRRRFRHRGETGSLDDYLRVIRGADIVAASGGGYINDSFPRHATLVLETLQSAQNRGKATAIFGQGIGPLRDPVLRRLARRVLPRVGCIGLREGRAGVPLLRELGVADSAVVVTGDDAIDAAYAGRAESLGDALGVNVRVAAYSGVDDAALQRLADAIGAFRARVPARVTALPISFHEGDSDTRSIARVFECMGAPLAAPERFDSAGLIARVATCRVVLTGSYHAGVFALSQGIPVVALARTPYYEDKFYGLSEQFPGGMQVVSPDEPSAVTEALVDRWAGAERGRGPLLEAAQRQIATGRAAYGRLRAIVQRPQGAA